MEAQIGSVIVGTAFFGILLAFLLLKSRGKPPPLTSSKDMVCLYQVGRGPWAPSLSPFPLKLETFLRMAQIPYMNDHSGQMSLKGKTPWITYNGQAVADSQFSIEFIKRERGVDVEKHLTSEQQAVSRALREMTEEQLYWTMCYESFIKHPESLDILLKGHFSRLKTFLFKKLMGRTIRQEMWGHGIGRHTDTEIWDIGKRDLMALAHFLGSKPFIMGNEATEVDCAVFGMLAMVVWQMKGSRHEKLVHEEFPNLVEYCHRMRNKFWPDWDHRCKGEHFIDDHHKLITF